MPEIENALGAWNRQRFALKRSPLQHQLSLFVLLRPLVAFTLLVTSWLHVQHQARISSHHLFLLLSSPLCIGFSIEFVFFFTTSIGTFEMP
jgi:hypothetical protein